MRTLCIPKNVFDEIARSVSETPRGCETGVTLFGTSVEGTPDAHYVVLTIAGPGRRATHDFADRTYGMGVRGLM